MKQMRAEILRELRYPVTAANILRKRQQLRKELLAQPNLLQKRIAILGGSTTTELRSILELFLLAHGIEPTFYESGYNRYAEDVLFENPQLWSFHPDIVFIHTSWRNVSEFPDLQDSIEQVEQRLRREMDRFQVIWEKIHTRFGAVIVQNNFDLPRLRPLGNLDASENYGRVNFLMKLNAGFAAYASAHQHLLINDIHYLSAQVGLEAWYGHTYWYNFHMAVTPAATVALARNIAGIIKAVFGKSKKCLVLDLDNTLWGGVVGDDGAQNLILGRDHPVGEAFLDFQRYVKTLQRRGVILAVCSKNELENAKAGFSHPDSILRVEDFSAFKANWNPKPDNIREIAAELNIGLDSIVFLDDNPAERALVANQLPEVATPEIGNSVSRFAEILESEHYFEAYKLVQEDLERVGYYSSNAQRSAAQATFANYDEYLLSLEMEAEIAPFAPVYLERITQLINKTNQFNLTTRRYTSAEVEAIAHDPGHITLYGRLADRFGDNGLVTVLIGHIAGEVLEIDLWLMSCRVLNREMELSMFDAVVEACQARGLSRILGTYIPSKKNALVADHYRKLGFRAVEEDPGSQSSWSWDVPETYSPASRSISRAAKRAGSQANEAFIPTTAVFGSLGA
jgi:FkbH-like protein